MQTVASFRQVRAEEQTIIICSEPNHFRNVPQTDKERKSLHFFFRHHPYPACQVFLSAQTPDGDLKPHWCHKQHATCHFFFFLRSAYQSEIQSGQGRYSRDLPKGNQQRATNCISSICCVQQDVAMHRFLYL